MKNKFYELTAIIDGEKEVIYGSFNRSDCTYEKEAEKDTLKSQGYKSLKIEMRLTSEQPDPEIYAETAAERLALIAVSKGLTITVECEGETDIEESSDSIEVIEHLKAVDCICQLSIFENHKYLGTFAVSLDDLEPEETIIDYTVNEVCESLYSEAIKAFEAV